MKRLFVYALGILLSCTPFACGDGGNDAKAPSPSRQAYYDFFNDIRREVAPLADQYSRLENFAADTKTFLETREAQQGYDIGALYYEKGLNREQGAYNYADRFAADGMVLLVAIFAEREKEIYDARLEKTEGSQGKQVGQNYVLYQVFTAKPRDAELEERLTTIIEAQLQNHAADIGR